MVKADSIGPDVSSELVGRVGVVTIDRPPVNAFTAQTYIQLEAALWELESDPDCLAIVLRSGNDRAFCAGADLSEPSLSVEEDENRQRIVRRVLNQVIEMPQPVICAIDGPARGGGCAIAACCDVRLASTRSSFAMPEISVGRAGGARHLMRVLPVGAVRLAYFTGWPLSAEEAYRLGMVQILAPDEAGAVDVLAMKVATEIASKNPLAIRYAKEALDLAERLSVSDGYRIEQQFGMRLSIASQNGRASLNRTYGLNGAVTGDAAPAEGV